MTSHRAKHEPKRPLSRRERVSDLIPSELESLEERLMLAAASPIGPSLCINGPQTEWQTLIGALPMPDGNSMMVWTDSRGDRFNFQVVAPDGSPTGPVVKHWPASDADSSSVAAINDHGEMVVAWRDGSYLRAQKFDAEAGPIGPEVHVHDNKKYRSASPSVAIDNDGDFIVTWGGYWDGEVILARRFNSDSQPAGEVFQVNDGLTVAEIQWNDNLLDDQEYKEVRVALPTASAVAMDDDGDFVVAYSETKYNQFRHVYQTDDDYYDYYRDFYHRLSSNVLIKRFDASGHQVGPASIAGSFGTLWGSGSVGVDMDDDGDFAVAWAVDRLSDKPMQQSYDGYTYFTYSYRDLGDVLMARRFESDGRPSGPAVPIVNLVSKGTPGTEFDPDTNQSYKVMQFDRIIFSTPAVAMDDDGDFLVAFGQYNYTYTSSEAYWYDEDTGKRYSYGIDYAYSGDMTAKDSTVSVRRFNKAGKPIGGNILVETVPAEQGVGGPHVALSGGDNFIVGWTNYISDDYKTDVFTRAYQSPKPDLIGEFGVITLPSSVVHGYGAVGKVSIIVRNVGDAPAVGVIDVEVVLLDPATGNHTVLTELIGRRISIKPGRWAVLKTVVSVPSWVENGQYELAAMVDSSDSMSGELDEENNYFFSFPYGLTVDEPFYDLTAHVWEKARIPVEAVGGRDRVKLPVVITNNGNMTLAKTQTVDIGVYARPTFAADDSMDELVAFIANRKVGGLKPGASINTLSLVTLPNHLDGDYVLVAKVDDPLSFGSDPGPGGGVGFLAELIEDNNEAVSAPISIERGHWDLTGVVHPGARIPEWLMAGDGTRVKLPIVIRNEGNLAFPRGQRIGIDVFARPIDGGADVPVATFENVSISQLKAGRGLKRMLTVTLPGGLVGVHQLVAVLDGGASGSVVIESDEDNNEIVTDPAISPMLIDTYMTLTGLDAVGLGRIYADKVIARGHVVAGNADLTGVLVEAAQDGRARVVTVPDPLDSWTVLSGPAATMSQTAAGSVVDRWDSGGGIGFDVDALVIAPPTLRLRTRHTDTALATLSVELGEITGELMGQAWVRTVLLGYQTVVTPGLTGLAAKVTVSMGVTALGTVATADGNREVRLFITATETQWALPGIGIVKAAGKVVTLLKSGRQVLDVSVDRYARYLVDIVTPV